MSTLEEPPMPVWTAEQVTTVNEYQQCGFFHPYTCGGGGGPCPGVSMTAGPEGLVCPSCGRVQAWVHDFVLAEQWRESAAALERLRGRGH